MTARTNLETFFGLRYSEYANEVKFMKYVCGISEQLLRAYFNILLKFAEGK
jgi:hypothetical protein